jgi:hypothetical protein
MYYLKTEKLVEQFIANTFAYVSKSLPPLVPASLFILGPPKSGKTMFAQRIAKSLDLVYLNVPIVLEAILEGNEDTLLHDKVLLKFFMGRLKSAWSQAKWFQKTV